MFVDLGYPFTFSHVACTHFQTAFANGSNCLRLDCKRSFDVIEIITRNFKRSCPALPAVSRAGLRVENCDGSLEVSPFLENAKSDARIARQAAAGVYRSPFRLVSLFFRNTSDAF